MAYNYTSLKKIINIAKKLSEKNKKISVLSLGYPDLAVRKKDLRELSNQLDIFSCKVSDQEAALKWHNLPSKQYTILSLPSILKTYAEIDFFYTDISEGTGESDSKSNFIKLDLNNPLKNSIKGKFDLVLDSGTSEHCFNIGNVFKMYFDLLKVGGYLDHWSPFLVPNHGFYSLNPTIFYDLERSGMFEIISYELFGFRSYRKYFECKFRKIHYHHKGRFNLRPWNFLSIILNHATLHKVSDTFNFPIQSKYLDLKN